MEFSMRYQNWGTLVLPHREELQQGEDEVAVQVGADLGRQVPVSHRAALG